jgi:Ca2+-binding RTX toxin-like protein
MVTWHSLSDPDSSNIHQRHFAPDISGGDEADDLVGTNWDERISGLDGSDTLIAGNGRDLLTGGAGQDVLVGGGGADTFVFLEGDTDKTRAGADTIEDFSVKQKDVIDLSAIDADTTRGPNNRFDFIGGERFHKEAGELRLEKKGGDIYLMGDTDGNGKADFMIHLDGVVKLATPSFEL